jgi:hypothetical protein
LRVLDLYSGSGSATQPFKDRGHDVDCVDIIHGIDAREFHAGALYDFVWASPPCQAFSVAGFQYHHFVNGKPMTETARTGVELLWNARRIISEAQPKFFVIENPRGLMRRQVAVLDLKRVTVWYCQYGAKQAKPTDLWGGFPPSWDPKPPCHNGNPDHESAKRGSKSGIQGLGSGDKYRAKVPYELGLSLCLAAEKDL